MNWPAEKEKGRGLKMFLKMQGVWNFRKPVLSIFLTFLQMKLHSLLRHGNWTAAVAEYRSVQSQLVFSYLLYVFLLLQIPAANWRETFPNYQTKPKSDQKEKWRLDHVSQGRHFRQHWSELVWVEFLLGFSQTEVPWSLFKKWKAALQHPIVQQSIQKGTRKNIPP